MYGRIFFNVASVHALWSFLSRSSGGLSPCIVEEGADFADKW